jgi:hypothetical protein
VVRFKVPPVPGGVFGKLSQTSVLFAVKLGLVSRSVGFSLQYTPVIQGPCVIETFYPASAFPQVDTVLTLQAHDLHDLSSFALN